MKSTPETSSQPVVPAEFFEVSFPSCKWSSDLLPAGRAPIQYTFGPTISWQPRHVAAKFPMVTEDNGRPTCCRSRAKVDPKKCCQEGPQGNAKVQGDDAIVQCLAMAQVVILQMEEVLLSKSRHSR